MGIDHDGLAVLAELAAVSIFSRCADGDAREDPRAAALFGIFGDHPRYRAMRAGV